MEYDGTNAAEVVSWTAGKAEVRNGNLLISTLEGVMLVTPGDFVIRGVQGEFYPCKPDIFEETYDQA